MRSALSLAAGNAEMFRAPLSVSEILRTWTGNTYPVCPRCHVTLEREYQSYCDHCGQCLDWKQLRHARIILPVRSPAPCPGPLAVHGTGAEPLFRF